MYLGHPSIHDRCSLLELTQYHLGVLSGLFKKPGLLDICAALPWYTSGLGKPPQIEYSSCPLLHPSSTIVSYKLSLQLLKCAFGIMYKIYSLSLSPPTYVNTSCGPLRSRLAPSVLEMTNGSERTGLCSPLLDGRVVGRVVGLTGVVVII